MRSLMQDNPAVRRSRIVRRNPMYTDKYMLSLPLDFRMYNQIFPNMRFSEKMDFFLWEICSMLKIPLNTKQTGREMDYMERIRVEHTFEPVCDANSRILILGSFPSVKSREQQFYYGHPQNRFWKVMTALCGEAEMPETTEEKKVFLQKHRIALWDVIASCDMTGSSDSSIRNVEPNSIESILKRAQIEKIFLNGDKAYRLFLRYCRKEGQPPAEKLPSTSPANAAYHLEKLIEIWGDSIGGLLP